MPALYVHVPFCRRACAYCDFFFVTGKKYFSEESQLLFAQALMREMCSYARDSLFFAKKFSSVYFGGGTPSLFTFSALKRVMDCIKKNFLLEENAEITMEVNPEDITEDLANQWFSLGFNRISLGVQSLWSSSFDYLGRKFMDREEVMKKISLLHSQGFNNINIDLIVGFPSMKDEYIVQDLSCLSKQKGVRHFSVYLLTIENRTRLKKEIENKKKLGVCDEKQANQYKLTAKTLKNLGYERYEVSNYCRDHFYSQHNCGYWLGSSYLGVGPSAHSFDGWGRRKINMANLAQYIKYWQKERDLSQLWPENELEILDEKMRYQEMLITRLRTKWGLLLDDLEKNLGEKYSIHLQKSVTPFLKCGWMEQFFSKNSFGYRFTDDGILYADGIIEKLFI